MSEYPWNEKSNTFTWLSSLYNPFKKKKIYLHLCHQNYNFSFVSQSCRLCYSLVILVLFVSHSCLTHVAFVLHLCCSCFTCVAFVLFVPHLCCTCIASVSFVLHLCCSCCIRVAYFWNSCCKIEWSPKWQFCLRRKWIVLLWVFHGNY